MVLEVALWSLRIRKVVKPDCLLVLRNPEQAETADHARTVTSIVVVPHDPGMPDRDQGKETLCTTQHASKLIERASGVSTLERPDQPRVKAIVPRAIRDVRDAGQELCVQGDAGGLNTKMV